jgi:TolA-binding protein
MGASGCSTLMFWQDDPAEGAAASDGDADAAVATGGKGDVKPKTSALEEQELKLAKLWARVDELEEEQYRQKERFRVLEKGMTLGLVPEELKSPAPVKAEPKEEPKVAVVAPPAEPVTPLAPAVSVQADGLDAEGAEKYQAAFTRAHDLYRAGRYGQAAAEFDKIGEEFGEGARGGQHLYWIARCWADLKELATARQRFAEFVEKFPGSPWAPRAQLELGRVEWKLGLNETAIKRFRDLIQQHPFEDASEMARMELDNLQKTL